MEEEVLPEEKKASKKPEKIKKKKKEQLLTISNTCKNCDTPLNLDQAFCSSCGAKRMYNRLNWSNLTEDFVDRFLNIENNFLRTFFALFKKPEDVIGGYIDGMRKRYLSAFSYFAISLTISGLYTFVFRKWFLNDEMFNQGLTAADGVDIKGTADAAKDLMNWFFEYQSLLTFITIPFYALASKLAFWNYKKYNFIEHVVIYLYVYSHTQIIMSILSILFIWSSIAQVFISFLLMFGYIVYTVFVLKRLFDLTIEKALIKTVFFLVVMSIISVFFFGIASVFFYKMGVFDTFIEKIKEAQESQKAIKEAARTVKDSIRIDSVKQFTKSVKDTVLLFGS